jgi:hypothetical protein
MGAVGIDPFVFKIMAVISVLVVTSLMLFIWKFTAPKEGNNNNREKSENEEIENEKQVLLPDQTVYCYAYHPFNSVERNGEKTGSDKKN